MKTALLLVLCLSGFSAWAQKFAPAEPVPPVPPVPPIPAATPVPESVPKAPRKVFAQAVEATGTALAQVKEAVEKAKVSALAQADFALEFGKEAPASLFFRSSAKPGRTLVVPGKEMNVATANSLEEDLNVMSLILEKAVERKSEDEGPKAMGINVFSSGSSSGVKNLYLEGYGATFILKVRFPLMPPPEKGEVSKTNEPTSSAWTEAWRDLYGPRGEWGGEKGVPREFGFPRSFGWSAEDYDADKVDKLKLSILDALKNASNIRHLKSDEKVTVVVTSSAGSADVKKKRATEENRSSRGSSYRVEVQDSGRRSDGRGAQSVLTIHAKKTDIDSFAKGKLTPEEFRKRAIVTLY